MDCTPRVPTAETVLRVVTVDYRLWTRCNLRVYIVCHSHAESSSSWRGVGLSIARSVLLFGLGTCTCVVRSAHICYSGLIFASGILHSLRSLLWTALFVLVVIYTCAVFCTWAYYVSHGFTHHYKKCSAYLLEAAKQWLEAAKFVGGRGATEVTGAEGNMWRN